MLGRHDLHLLHHLILRYMYFPSAFDGSDLGVSSFPSTIAFEYPYELLRHCNVSHAPTLADRMCQDIKWHNSLSFKLLHQAYIDVWTRFVLAADLDFGHAGETARHIPLDYDRSLDSEGIIERTPRPEVPMYHVVQTELAPRARFCYPATSAFAMGFADWGVIHRAFFLVLYASWVHPSARTVVDMQTQHYRAAAFISCHDKQTSRPIAIRLLCDTPPSVGLDHVVRSPHDVVQILRSRTPVWACCLLRTRTCRSPRGPSSKKANPFPNRARRAGGVDEFPGFGTERPRISTIDSCIRPLASAANEQNMDISLHHLHCDAAFFSPVHQSALPTSLHFEAIRAICYLVTCRR